MKKLLPLEPSCSRLVRGTTDRRTRPRNRSSRSIESIVWGRSRVELREGPKVKSTDRVDRLAVELS